MSAGTKAGVQAMEKQYKKIRVTEQRWRLSLRESTMHCPKSNSVSLPFQATSDTCRVEVRKGGRSVRHGCQGMQ